MNVFAVVAAACLATTHVMNVDRATAIGNHSAADPLFAVHQQDA
jgi:hypothetical protein